MLIFKIIRVIFSGTIFFVGIGLITIVGSAMFSALMDAELEDGSTFKETINNAISEVNQAYAPIFEDVDVKEVLRQDTKELEQYGRETIRKIRKKTDPIIDKYGPIIEKKIKEVEEVINEHKK